MTSTEVPYSCLICGESGLGTPNHKPWCENRRADPALESAEMASTVHNAPKVNMSELKNCRKCGSAAVRIQKPEPGMVARGVRCIDKTCDSQVLGLLRQEDADYIWNIGDRPDPAPDKARQGARDGDEEGRLQRLLMDAQAQCPPSYSEVWMRCIQPMLDHRSNQLIAANAEIERLKRELEVIQAKAFRVSSVAYAQRNDIVVRDTLIRQLTDALRATKDAAEYDGPNLHNGYLLYLKSVDLRDQAIAAAESMTKDGTTDVS